VNKHTAQGEIRHAGIAQMFSKIDTMRSRFLNTAIDSESTTEIRVLKGLYTLAISG
jgi:hypothetical protein